MNNITNKNSVIFYRSVKEALNSVGEGMCLAKWYQVTMHLENGHNHSCHHPRTHQTPIDELAVDVSALHNTNYKKQQREIMLTGGRPEECRYCWNIEDNVKHDALFSDRVLKSSEWQRTSLRKTVEQGSASNVYPKSLEVSFSTTCNFKCSYCSADVSSRWMKELLKFGSYPTEFPLITLEQIERGNKIPISDGDYNPYIEAFWKWWPDLYQHLEVMRITGGEPLLSQHTFKVFDWIITHPKNDLELAVNSNMCVPDVLINRFIDKIKKIISTNSVKEFILYTSCEGYSAQAEYIRHGLNYNQWLNNCKKLLTEVPQASIRIMATYNSLSTVSFLSFLKDITLLKKTFKKRISVDTVYMANPKCLTIDILSQDYLKYIDLQVRYVKIMYDQQLYTEWEFLKISRLKEYFVSKLTNPVEQRDMFRRDFKVFVDEHDRRRGTNFLKTFPEMQQFYNLCAQS